MKIQNSKIVEATENELYDYYLTRGWCDVYDFPPYKRLCKEQGTIVTDEQETEARERQETHDDIAGELRDLSKSDKYTVNANPKLLSPTVFGKPICVYFAELADRMDATHKREVTEAATKAATSAVNLTKEKYTRLLAETAKLRDALDAVVKVGYPHNFQREAYHIRSYCEDMTAAIRKCFNALASLNTGSEVKP